MKPEIIEALALELTKSKLANKDTTASDWVKTYLESEKQIKEAVAKANPPAVDVSDIPIFGR